MSDERLGSTLFLAALVHGVVILGVTVLLVRYLLVGTRAAQIYPARLAPATPPAAPVSAEAGA